MSAIESIIFYNIVFGIILFFLKRGERNKNLEYVGVFILILLSVLRFDIGADYENYYLMINRIAKYIDTYDLNLKELILFDEFHVEISFYFIIWLFHKLDNTFVYVFAIYSLITIYFWYKTFKKNNSLFWGIFAIITLSILFNSYNGIRQAVSYAIFLYSLQFLDSENRNIKKYVLYIILAIIFHTSAIFLLAIIPIVNIKPRIKLYVSIIIILTIGAYLNIWNGLINFIFLNSFFYQGFIDNANQSSASIGKGIMFPIYVFFYTYCMCLVKEKRIYTNVLFLGIILFCISTGNNNINRVAMYFLNVIALILPLYVKAEKNKFKLVTTIFMFVFLFQLLLFRNDNRNLCIPYDYVGSENFDKERLRIRNYKEYKEYD